MSIGAIIGSLATHSEAIGSEEAIGGKTMPETIGKRLGSKAEDASSDVSCSGSTRLCTLHKRSEELALQTQDDIAKEFHTDAEDRGLVLAEQLRENSAIAGVKRGSPEPTFEAEAMLSVVEAAH